MSLFGKILSKLGIKKDEAKTTPSQKGGRGTSAGPSRPSAKASAAARQAARGAGAPSSSSAPMPMVDVVSKLEKMASGTDLDWKVSIVDLLKVLDLDSSKSARKELAQELGCPPDQMKDPELRDMNQWLHKTVLAKIAENGGNIPKELLD